MCRPRSCPSCWDGMWLLEKQSDLPAVLCALPRRHVDPCVSRRELRGLPAPAPPSRESTVPLPLSPGPMWPSRGCVSPPEDLCASASDSAHAREAACNSQGQFGPKQGFRNQMRVMAISCASLSYFNTRFITCSEISVRRYFLND